jgi:hypothetical protein
VPGILEATAVSAAQQIVGRLAGGEVVVIDGGTGTQLQVEVVPMDDNAWSGRANPDHGHIRVLAAALPRRARATEP